MRGVKPGCALWVAVFAAVLLRGLASAQMQPAASPQNGVSQSGSGTTPRPGATANSPATSPSPEGSSESSWSAGRGGFGARTAMPGATNGAEGSTVKAPAGNTGQSSWVAGREGFGSTVQVGGIWRDKARSYTPTSGKTAGKPAIGTYAPVASPNFNGAAPAFTIKPINTQPAHAVASHSSAGAHAGVTRPGAALRGPRGSTLGRPSTKATTTGLRTHISSRSGGRISVGPRAKPSGFGPTAQSSPIFTPSAHSPNQGETPAPVAPPQ
jgi:hypothetical protein